MKIKNIAINEEMAIDIAVSKLNERYDSYVDHVYTKVNCDYGKINAVIVYGDKYSVKVRYCEHCESDDATDVDCEITELKEK